MCQARGPWTDDLIQRFRSGDEAAAEELWQLYIKRLVALAQARLGSFPQHVADPEEVALSAFASFARRARQGQFPRLRDEQDLWCVLLTITTRKSRNLIRYLRAGKRDIRKEEHDAADLDEVLGTGPSPETVAEISDGWRRLLEILPDQALRDVAIWKIEGYTNDEIARMLGRSAETVRRKLRAIGEIWTKSGEQPT
jgi:DNA-directed RNA polymerase specialized sigma24 family protein